MALFMPSLIRFFLVILLLIPVSTSGFAQVNDRFGVQNRGIQDRNGFQQRNRIQNQCRAGQLRCGRNCCPVGQRCSFDGNCIPPGGTYCGGGFSCGPFERCVGNRRCAPKGENKCRSSLDCPSGTSCNGRGECEAIQLEFTLPRPKCDDGRTCASGTSCLPGGGCTRPGWFLCEETGSQCRQGFKCSANQGCVPVKAVDCGNAKWCRPGERCLPEGGCEKLPEGSEP
ncbi:MULTISPECIES: scavenger receptor class F, member 2 [unclassified Ruegeria]|uniref:scavenger receptor class F, member 2 n=1 Tax=unclassified Ruegeria TaxID=2625375 RepID=UPI001AD951B6|nr:MULTISPECIES: scavenger receptor class F, member 2 [unclassified Ruegeria]MBO9411614.1 scavenger receptor class F, member 2 [Ruegeria sp. R8_1]MBO9415824.1 scavenger receptor class F, member 2 [Ruegeria sp. R8_2]